MDDTGNANFLNDNTWGSIIHIKCQIKDCKEKASDQCCVCFGHICQKHTEYITLQLLAKCGTLRESLAICSECFGILNTKTSLGTVMDQCVHYAKPTLLGIKILLSKD